MRLTHVLIAGSAATLALFGAGCFRVAPRVTEAPNQPAQQVATQGATAPAPTTAALAYVHMEPGSVATLTRGGETENAVENAELSGGDRVVVTTGTVDLIYPDAGRSRLTGGSDVTLVADPQKSGFFAEVQLAAGSIWTRFERLLDSGEHFSVQANGVVATVRGTAFGVTVDGSDADVQVADHFVEVSSVSSTSVQSAPDQRVRLEAGQAIRLGTENFRTSSVAELRTRIRALTDIEKLAQGYRFAAQRLDLNALHRPIAPVKVFRIDPVLKTELQTRLQLLQSVQKMQIQFLPPTHGILQQDIAPTTTAPAVNGPSV